MLPPARLGAFESKCHQPNARRQPTALAHSPAQTRRVISDLKVGHVKRAHLVRPEDDLPNICYEKILSQIGADDMYFLFIISGRSRRPNPSLEQYAVPRMHAD